MINPSPWSHLYRLGILLGAAFIAFLVIKALATPPSWNHEGWYRGDALIDMAAQPLAHGANESCRDCHEDAVKKVKKLKHRKLSCEGCHGALADHVLQLLELIRRQVYDHSGIEIEEEIVVWRRGDESEAT